MRSYVWADDKTNTPSWAVVVGGESVAVETVAAAAAAVKIGGEVVGGAVVVVCVWEVVR